MAVGNGTGDRPRNLVLAAMIFAVAMTFIDQTIVSIAAPQIQRELGLTSTGVQWAINAYLLSLAALFAFGGRLADTVGHTRMVVVGVILFAGSSAMCGLTPKGSVAEGWIVTFRVVQGAGGAIMFPAALAIVVQTFALRERGKALALFFGIAGGLTSIGPILGGFLTQWTWRAIFWVNIPVALVALVLIAMSKPTTVHRAAPMDYRGLALIVPGVALSVFGFQQSAIWGWSNPGTGLVIAAGVVLLVVFGVLELRTASPLIQMRIFKIRAFLVENLVLGIAMLVFVPVFFFASEYAQIALDKTASQAGLYLLYFFLGFVVMSQIGGTDPGPARRQETGSARMCSGCGGVLPLGRQGHAARFRDTGVVRRPRRWGNGVHAHPVEHRRRESSVDPLVRRGDRDHPDRPELCRQSGVGDPGNDPGVGIALPSRHVAHVPRSSRRPGGQGGGEHLPGPERKWEYRVDPALHTPGLRLRHPQRPARHGVDHGRGRCRGPGRAGGGPTGGVHRS